MQVDQLTFDKAEAEKLLRKYREHKAYQKPIDAEIERIAKLVTSGKAVIRGIGSVTLAGLNEARLPKLAIMRADQPWCHFKGSRDGSGTMLSGLTFAYGNTTRARVFNFEPGALPDVDSSKAYRAMAPHMPPDVRPNRGLENYTLLWEAEWQWVPPVDPILARRIGNSDFFMVLAQWDLSPIERFVMQARIGRQ